MIEVFKMIHNLYDIESSPKLLRWEDVSFRTANRGHTLKLITQRAKTNIGKNAFPITVTEPWNFLPETVVQAKSDQEESAVLKSTIGVYPSNH